MKKENKIMVAFRLSKETLERLSELETIENKNRTWITEQAISEYFARQKRKNQKNKEKNKA